MPVLCDAEALPIGAALRRFLQEPDRRAMLQARLAETATKLGGTGAHYCVGANLARMTIDLMFGAIADVMPNLESVGRPERLRSGWLNGIKHWQVDYHTDGAAKCPVAH